MKLVKQANLEYRDGKSDKVYEVDLCQVGDDQYVVNFRYGRRGSNLREGSRTPLPVKRPEAEREFAKLVASKVKKGYENQIDTATAPEVEDVGVRAGSGPSGPTDAPALGPREHAVLERLRLGERASRGAWDLDRAIWRAGELALAEAVPILVDRWQGMRQGASEGKLLRRYSLAWALGRCGEPGGDATAVTTLEAIVDAHDEADPVRRIALEGLRRLYKDDRRAALIEDHIDRLPGRLAELARTGPADAFTAALLGELDRGKGDPGRKSALRALETCYLIDSEHVRPGLLRVLRDKPLGKNYFLRMRHIFKAAEFRRDGEVFGILAHRFETTAGKPVRWYQRRQKQSDPFYEPTRRYLRRRVWRTLRRLGRDEDPAFVPMAVGVLLPFTDDQGGAPRTRRRYSSSGRWRRPDIVIRWDRFSGFWAFNHLLYGRSPRYYPDGNGRAWRCRDGYEPGGPAPAVREESFPALWQRTPHGLLHLLDESRCQPVHEFATRALRACPEFLAELDAGVAILLLDRPYDVTVELGYELAERIYDPLAPHRDLLLAMAGCRLDRARRTARGWIDRDRTRFVEDTQLVAAMAASPHADNRDYTRGWLMASVLHGDTARAIIGRLFAAIDQLTADDDDRIAGVAETLVACFGTRLADIGVEVIRDLLAHPAAAAQELAGRLILGHGQLAEKLPDSLLVAFLDSPHESVRAVGSRLLAQLPDTALLARRELIVLLATHELADLRAGVRPVIKRLADLHPDFAIALVGDLTAALMAKQAKGVHTHLLSLLADDLQAHLHVVDRDTIWKLLHHRHPHAQELGGVLLASALGPDDLTVAEIVKLASHEILAVRRGAWAMAEKAIDRLQRAMPAAIRLLEARWQDSREFAMQFFRDKFTAEHLGPDILVAVCDSVRPDVQRFGRELITRYFRDQDGQTYLLKLSEHPGEALQLFATNYLERYAGGSPERIAELEPYFVRVLSQVNKGRIAKQRCIAFLRREAVASAAAAEVAARVFGRQSVTLAVTDREAMIEAMVCIARAHPALSLPIRIHDAPTRPPSGAARAGDGPPEASRGV